MAGTGRWRTGLVAVALLLCLTVAFSGCGLASSMFSVFRRPSPAPGDGQGPISPNPDGNPVRLTLYYGDMRAEALVGEVRTVIQRGETAEELAIQELIKGPAQEGHGRTVPRETKLLSIQVVEGVAYVNLSPEVQTKHPGGSTGEVFTVQSIANTLSANNPAIEKVQFLLEGKVEESIWGHGITSEPIAPIKELIR